MTSAQATAATVEVLARAKINPYLAVGPQGRDRYHRVATVMQSVDLADTLVLRSGEERRVTFARGDRFTGDFPSPPDLVERALSLFATDVQAGAIEAEVTKTIPLAAGLAGGSADAAAALLAADALTGGHTPRLQLEALCHELGSDVPFCLRGGAVLATGRGDVLSPLPVRHQLWWVLGIAGFPLSTADVYRRLDELRAKAPDAEPEERLARPSTLIAGLTAGHVKTVAQALRNDLEAPAFDLAPALAKTRNALKQTGAVGVVMTGSGPTLAAICRNEAHAFEVAARAAALFPRVEVVATTRAGAELVT